MSGQVILYFDDQADALRFALAAGSVMAGEAIRATDDLVQETARVKRILLTIRQRRQAASRSSRPRRLSADGPPRAQSGIRMSACQSLTRVSALSVPTASISRGSAHSFPH